jgi:hypothetical protein
MLHNRSHTGDGAGNGRVLTLERTHHSLDDTSRTTRVFGGRNKLRDG